MTTRLILPTKTPDKIIVDILKTELELSADRVMLTNQKTFTPTLGVFLTVSFVGPAKVISSCNTTEDDGDGLIEVQSLTMLHQIQIEIMSYSNTDGSNDARDRKEEIAMALRSVYSQQQQEKYSMQISRNISPILDTSYLEATQMLTHYTTTVETTSLYEKKKTVDSYANFNAEFYQDDFHVHVPVLVPPLNPTNP